MTTRLLVAVAAAVAALLSAAELLTAQDRLPPLGYIIFKDGFTINGMVITQKHYEIDPSSGISYSVPSANGFTLLDDNVRRVYFPPGQIADIVRLKPGETEKDLIVFTKQAISPKKPLLLPAWKFGPLPPFDKHWEREVKVICNTESFPMKQRVVLLSPQRMVVQGFTHGWDMSFLTKEITFDDLNKLMTDYLDVKKEFKDFSREDKDLVIARFYAQMGEFERAEQIANELRGRLKAPDHVKKLEEFVESLLRDKAKKLTAELEPLVQSKQHRTIRDRLAFYDKNDLASKVPQKVQLLAQDLKNKYESDDAKLAKARSLFQFLMEHGPTPRGFWLNAVDTMLHELNYDTLPKLDTFLTFAEQFKRDMEENKTPSQKLENVFALAVTGWHLGNVAAEPDVKLAQTLWKGRKFVPEYMKADTPGQRELVLDAFLKETKLPIDVIARLLQNLPPPNAFAKLSTEPMTLKLDLPDGPVGSYLLQLPPDYHHQRAHPLLMLLHGREDPEMLMKRWRPIAARFGFILVAPQWTNQQRTDYFFSDSEHAYFLNVLRDVKRKFQVDTDRVFLYGWGQGADVAWDVGLGHPDQFAGLLPMCGTPGAYAKIYWPNAQNLGVYIVDGDKSGGSPVVTRGMFKEWIRCNYNAYFLEYKGRGNELFIGEFEPMMDWMSRKKRHYPARDVGKYSATSSHNQEFRSYRHGDNRFYWLSSDEISDKFTQDHGRWDKNRTPALMQGQITVANESDSKGNAKIVTTINLHVAGLKQVTVWLEPTMVDFSKPIQLRINARAYGKAREVTPSISTMLEEYFNNVDRQRLYYARIDSKL